MFKTVIDSGAPLIGAIPESKTHDYFLSLFGGGYPQSAFVAPVSVLARTVNVVYGDLGPSGAMSGSIADVILCLQSACEAYERLIRERLARESA